MKIKVLDYQYDKRPDEKFGNCRWLIIFCIDYSESGRGDDFSLYIGGDIIETKSDFYYYDRTLSVGGSSISTEYAKL